MVYASIESLQPTSTHSSLRKLIGLRAVTKRLRLSLPMIATIQVLVLLLAVVAATAVIANRLKIPTAILLVLTGVLIALVPGLPPIELAPEFVLLLILPPFIYTSAFQFNLLRPITLPVAVAHEVRKGQ